MSGGTQERDAPRAGRGPAAPALPERRPGPERKPERTPQRAPLPHPEQPKDGQARTADAGRQTAEGAPSRATTRRRRFVWFSDAEDSAAQRLFLTSLVWFAVGLLAGLLLIVYYSAPGLWLDLPAGLQRALEFGKVRMIHVDVMLWAWLSMALTAGMWYVVPRLCGTRLASERLANVAVWLWNVYGALLVVTLDMGMNRGREYGEPIWPLDLLFMAALGIVAYEVVATVARRRRPQLYVSLWYFLGSVVWLPIIVIVGKGLWSFTVNPYHGVVDNLANWFMGHAILGNWFTTAGVGLAYFLVPRLTRRPLFSHWLSLVGFWTIAFFYAPVGVHHTEWGPVPFWAQTESMLFSMLMFIPVWASMWNLGQTVAQNPRRVAESPELAFIVVGLAAYVLTSAQGSIQALRMFNGFEHFSFWVPGHAMLALGTGFSSIAIAAIYYAVPRLARRRLASVPAAWTHWALWTVGWALFIWLMQTGGLVQASNWRDGVIGWMQSTVNPMHPYLVGCALGGVLIVLGVAVMLWNVAATLTRGEPVAAAVAGLDAVEVGVAVLPPRAVRARGTVAANPDAPAAALPGVPGPAAGRASSHGHGHPPLLALERSVGALIGLALLLFSFSIVSIVALPALAAARYRPSPEAKPYTPLEAEGRHLYIEEGCWECHSQNVRLIEGGIGTVHTPGDIGPVSMPGDYVYQDPVLLGQHRRGPDLTHVAARWPSESWQEIHLIAPGNLHTGTWMPSFAYLTPHELQALAAYLETLR